MCLRDEEEVDIEEVYGYCVQQKVVDRLQMVDRLGEVAQYSGVFYTHYTVAGQEVFATGLDNNIPTFLIKGTGGFHGYFSAEDAFKSREAMRSQGLLYDLREYVVLLCRFKKVFGIGRPQIGLDPYLLNEWQQTAFRAKYRIILQELPDDYLQTRRINIE